MRRPGPETLSSALLVVGAMALFAEIVIASPRAVSSMVPIAAAALAAYSVAQLTPRRRRRRRMRRGRCPACNYDLRHDLSDGCPECGWHRQPAHTHIAALTRIIHEASPPAGDPSP